MPREAQPLRLASGERVHRLAEPQVPQPHGDGRGERSADLAVLAEEVARLVERQVEDLSDVAPAEGDLEHLGPEAAAPAVGAGDEDVGEELHLDPLQAVPLAGGAAPAAGVEREVRGREPPRARRRRRGEGAPHGIERLQVRCRVAARRAADGGLIDEDALLEPPADVDLVEAAMERLRLRFAGDAGGPPRGPLGIQLLRTKDPPRRTPPSGSGAPGQRLRGAQRLVKHVLHERALAGSAHPGHARQDAQRDRHVDPLEVVAAGALDLEALIASGDAPARRDRDRLPAREVASRQRGRALEDAGEGPLVDDPPAVPARAGAEVHHVVRLAHHLRLVLHHEDRVAEVAQSLEDTDQPPVVARVQTDAGLVEDVERVDQGGSERRGEVHPLDLAPGERPRLPVEREVTQPDLHQVPQPRPDLGQQQPGRPLFERREGQRVEEPRGLPHGQGVHFRDVEPPVEAEQHRLLLEARAAASRADDVGSVAGEEHADVHPVRAPLQPAEEAPDAVEAGVPFHDEPALRLLEVAEGDVRRDPARAAEGRQIPLRVPERLRLPGSHGAGGDRLAGIRDHFRQIDLDGPPESLARPAGADGRVEREEPRRGLPVEGVARRAVQRGAEAHLAAVVEDHRRPAPTVPERVLDRLGDPPRLPGADREPIHHHG